MLINFSWDEWVPESRVLKYNEANVARQKEVQKAHLAQGKQKKTNKKNSLSKTDSVKDSDSRASTPVSDITKGGKTNKRELATPSSGPESSSDVPRKKRGMLITKLSRTYEKFESIKILTEI